MEDPTLTITWVFSCLALLIMGVRLVWRKVAKESFNLGDYLTMGAIVCALARLGFIHVVLTWGTNNMSPTLRKSHHFTAQEIYRRQVGSKLALANRVFYNSYLWLQKLVLLDLYRRLSLNLWWEKFTTMSFLIVFFGTYVACQVTTFSECKPFKLYWQVLPDPGPCTAAQLQLLVVGITSIITDFMLFVLPIPLVVILKAPWQRKLQLLALFTLGIFIIVITIVRLPINATNKNSQVSRTTWASTELLAAAIVVNAPSIYGLWNHRRRAKLSNSASQGTDRYGSNSRGIHLSNVHRSVGGGESEIDMVPPKHKSSGVMGGIMQTKEVLVTDSRETDRSSKGYVSL